MFLIKLYFKRRAAMELQMFAEVKHYRLMLSINPYLILRSIHFDRVSKKVKRYKTRNSKVLECSNSKIKNNL